MSQLVIRETKLAGLCVLTRQPRGDARGYLERLFCQQTLEAQLGAQVLRQVNHTVTLAVGTVRGLHFQYPPHAEKKIVSCLRGQVLDVVVDLRQGSPTFLQHHTEVLSAENFTSLFIPEGFAHGFQTLTPDCEMLYFHTADYHPEAEGGVHALDPQCAITWPLPIAELSERDRNLPLWSDRFTGIQLP
jgi:dTDP-4-dehydrorhamnose 3,5-epimerase